MKYKLLILILGFISLLSIVLIISSVAGADSYTSTNSNSASKASSASNGSNGNALRLTLLTPSATFNVKENAYIYYFVKVENKNNFSIDIKIQKIKGIMFKQAVSFKLKPGQSKKVDFSYRAKKNETIQIPVTFSSKTQSFTLYETLNIYVTPKKPFLRNLFTHLSKVLSNSN